MPRGTRTNPEETTLPRRFALVVAHRAVLGTLRALVETLHQRQSRHLARTPSTIRITFGGAGSCSTDRTLFE